MLQQWKKALLLPAILLSVGSNTLANSIDENNSTYKDEIKTFKHSWIAKALKLQREIDINTPLNEATFLGTHNSYNAKSYQVLFPFIRYIDPNQLLSLYDQLEMGIRSIELDAHWTLNNHFSKDILLCHGQGSHIGCGPFDRYFYEGLIELRDWLKANPNEVVLLYIERHLDGHEPRLAALLEEYVGAYIFKPSSVRNKSDNIKSCVSLPSSLTKADILKAGKQLLIVAKRCDGTHPNYEEQIKFKQIWNDFVFAGISKIPTEPYSFLDSTIDDTIVYPHCGTSSVFHPDPHHTGLWRVFEDRTRLSPSKQLDAVEMVGLMHCGINWPTMDMLEVADPRLKATIWSWAPDYPKENKGECALYKYGEGMQNMACNQVAFGFACREAHTAHIKAIPASGTWFSGEFICQTMAGKNWHFIVPVNGKQIYTLKESMASQFMTEAWVNYANKQGQWIANSN